MKFVFDTDTCIAFLRGRDPVIRQRMALVSDNDIIVPSPVRAELFYGAARSATPGRTRQGVDAFLERFGSLAFDDAAADTYGRTRADLAVCGLIIGPNDLLIAAIALTHGLTLVTHNRREFERISTLMLDDWLVPKPQA